MRKLFKRDPDPFASSRYSDIFKSVRARQRKHMTHRWQWITLGVFVLITAICVVGIWKYRNIECKIRCGGEKLPQAEEGDPFNVLLIGSDSRTGLTPEEQLELAAGPAPGQRADTLILAHVDPTSDHITVVQFPRDLWVPIAGEDADNKINSALVGGPKQLVATMKQLTGLDINHYVMVNIAGFRDLVDAIDGVDICIPQTVPFDPGTGFQVTEPGTIHFGGDLAIRFVRSRKAFPGGDFDRIANQQKFVAAVLDKVTSVGTLLDPGRILELADVAGKNLRTDYHLNIPKLRDLLGRLRLDPDRYEAYTAPNLGTGRVGTASVVLPDMPKMKFMFEAIGRNESPAEADGVPSIDPSTIRLGVYNGVDLFRPYASEAAARISQATGGRIARDAIEIANAPNFRFKENLVRYQPEAKEMAELVAALLPNAQLEEHRTPRGIDVAVIVGRTRFPTRELVQILPIPIPRPSEQPAVCEQDGVAVTG